MSNRNIGLEILESVMAIKKGEGKHSKVEIPEDIKAIRLRLKLSQAGFSALLGVSIKTLQEWEQGRRKPNATARSLLQIANKRPEVVREVLASI